ncbi:Capsular glucan synthase [termite gut metagenome]|uniref:Capsular glucan synthase n=1 Tax=termite gut metagenome TaxID=433724 RepID=A0A5J4Q3B7_9ZZZZ
MKIVVTGTRGIPNIPGGVETHCEELFSRIAANGYAVTIIRRTNYVSENINEYKGVKLVDINAPKKKSFEAIVHTLKAVWKAKKLHADIIHIHAIGPAILTPIARMLGLKVVFTHHGADYDRDKWGKIAKSILKFGERMGCMFANEIIVISSVINQTIKQKYKRNDAHVIYNGVSVPNFINSTHYLNTLGIESGQYVFAMGRFVPEKNFHQLIHAFTATKAMDYNYKLVLAGDADFKDDYAKALKELARKEGIILTGFIKGEKLQTLLTHARVFVLPSSHEGLPIALLEAMSYRLPVIVSDIPANMEIGLPQKCYFQVGNEIELTKKLKTAFESSDTNKVDYPMEAYNWDFIAKQVIEVYKKVLPFC